MTTDDLRTRAEMVAKRVWPDRWDAARITYPHAALQHYRRGAFVQGALWHATQQPTREHVHVQVAARKAGKNSALADAIVGRANAQGLRVEFVTPSPTREQIARALFIASDPAYADQMAAAWDAPGEAGRQRWWNYADAVLALLDGAGS